MSPLWIIGSLMTLGGVCISQHAGLKILEELKRDGVEVESHYYLASVWNWRRFRPWVAHRRRGLPGLWRRVRLAGYGVMILGFIAMVLARKG